MANYTYMSQQYDENRMMVAPQIQARRNNKAMLNLPTDLVENIKTHAGLRSEREAQAAGQIVDIDTYLFHETSILHQVMSYERNPYPQHPDYAPYRYQPEKIAPVRQDDGTMIHAAGLDRIRVAVAVANKTIQPGQ